MLHTYLGLFPVPCITVQAIKTALPFGDREYKGQIQEAPGA